MYRSLQAVCPILLFLLIFLLFGAVLIYIIYSNLMGVGQSWIAAEKVSAILGLWWVHLLVMGLIAVFYVQRYGWYDLLPAKRRATP